MKPVLIFALIMVVAGAGCQTQKPEADQPLESNISAIATSTMEPSSDSVKTSTSTDAIPPVGAEGYMFRGVIASEYSQNSGMKMWRVDDNNRIVTSTGWIWVVPEVGVESAYSEGWHGGWVTFMIEHYAGISSEDQDKIDWANVVFKITGKREKDDCGLWDENDNEICVVNIEAKKIELEYVK